MEPVELAARPSLVPVKDMHTDLCCPQVCGWQDRQAPGWTGCLAVLPKGPQQAQDHTSATPDRLTPTFRLSI